jgi:hypothetical protein
VIQTYEQQLLHNPNEAEENFDKSVSMNKIRMTGDIGKLRD